MFCVLCRRLFWRAPKPGRAAETRGSRGQVFVPGVLSRSRTRAARQGGGNGPKQCPDDAQRCGPENQGDRWQTPRIIADTPPWFSHGCCSNSYEVTLLNCISLSATQRSSQN